MPSVATSGVAPAVAALLTDSGFVDVTVVGTAEAFGEELESKKLGAFKVKVRNISANTVDAELIH